jgi:hypothetical protein
MKRPVLLVVGAVAAALVMAGVGASAHTGLGLSKFIGVHTQSIGSEASGERTEPADTPEPTETPEAQQPAETEADNDADDQTEETGDNETENEGAAAAQSTTKVNSETGEHKSGTDHEESSTGKDD